MKRVTILGSTGSIGRSALDIVKAHPTRFMVKVLTAGHNVALLSAVVGAAGLIPTLSAIRSGKVIGLANKEALVMAGRVVMGEAKKYGSRILPVDSEHSAIFQCIGRRRKSDVRRIILTASGGPFSDRSVHDLDDITPEAALKHPRWKMGKKITID